MQCSHLNNAAQQPPCSQPHRKARHWVTRRATTSQPSGQPSGWTQASCQCKSQPTEQLGSISSRRSALLAAAGLLMGWSNTYPAHSHIPITSNAARAVPNIPPEANLGIPPDAQVRPLGSPYASFYRPPENDARSQVSTASRAKEAIARLQAAQAAVDQGQFDEALSDYTYVVQNFEDLALASYARTGRALMLYQVGRTSDALLALEDQEVLVRGTAEVHAALAALLWVERPNLAFRAEQQWEVAREFDTRYSNVEWVAADKHWPPKALDALNRFLRLQR